MIEAKLFRSSGLVALAAGLVIAARSVESSVGLAPAWLDFVQAARGLQCARVVHQALLVGLADNFGKALFPEISYFTLYAPMALILAVKPTGLFGRE